MVFNSYEFAVFFAAVLALYWSLPKRYQNPVLLVASYVFYGAWDWRFLGLIWLSTITDFLVARRIETTAAPPLRRRLLLLSVMVNLGILGAFKYAGFFVESFAGLLDGLGLAANRPVLDVVLPVGISFYTFQTLGYTIDVFKGRLPAERRLGVFALYVAFFPQLVAGPIERARRLLPQLGAPRTAPSTERITEGAGLIVIGLFKKVVIADGLAPIVNDVFADAGSASGLALLFGVYAFALQIYGDFSGYSSIARGTAKLLNIELMVNFRQPYLSKNITEFWRTWHISLSTWLRDYLYIPLGGNRTGVSRTYRNLMATMLLGGLWHGASWTFVVWGGLHGLYLAVHRSRGRRDRPVEPRPFGVGDVLPALATFHLVGLAWIFFRAETFSQAFEVLRGIAGWREGSVGFEAFWLVLVLGAASLFLDLAQRNGRSATILPPLAPATRGAFVGLVLVAVLVFSGETPVPFIYFQF
ncbi:MAG: MBOAT family O-acyltransferase [Acidimicrobiia bacterium]